MYNNEKIGVGIVTYNRRESFSNLLKQVLANRDVDYVVVVKNKNIDYGEDEPNADSSKYDYINVPQDFGVGYCKNQCLKKMLDNNCQHLFLIEDDMIIKKDNVFSEYIRIAKKFCLGHMNYNTLPNVKNNPTYTLTLENDAIDISFKCCGCFSYFDCDALLHCGMLNDIDYINCLEHAEHAYRFSLMGYCPPFYAFPGICNAYEYLQEYSLSSTIERHDQTYSNRAIAAATAFYNTYGKKMVEIPVPNKEKVVEYFQRHIPIMRNREIDLSK